MVFAIAANDETRAPVGGTITTTAPSTYDLLCVFCVFWGLFLFLLVRV